MILRVAGYAGIGGNPTNAVLKSLRRLYDTISRKAEKSRENGSEHEMFTIQLYRQAFTGFFVLSAVDLTVFQEPFVKGDDKIKGDDVRDIFSTHSRCLRSRG